MYFPVLQFAQQILPTVEDRFADVEISCTRKDEVPPAAEDLGNFRNEGCHAEVLETRLRSVDHIVDIPGMQERVLDLFVDFGCDLLCGDEKLAVVYAVENEFGRPCAGKLCSV